MLKGMITLRPFKTRSKNLNSLVSKPLRLDLIIEEMMVIIPLSSQFSVVNYSKAGSKEN